MLAVCKGLLLELVVSSCFELVLGCAWFGTFVFNVVAERGKASKLRYQSERAQYATYWVGCLDSDLRLEVWKDVGDHLSTTSVQESLVWCVEGADGPWSHHMEELQVRETFPMYPWLVPKPVLAPCRTCRVMCVLQGAP